MSTVSSSSINIKSSAIVMTPQRFVIVAAAASLMMTALCALSSPHHLVSSFSVVPTPGIAQQSRRRSTTRPSQLNLFWSSSSSRDNKNNNEDNDGASNSDDSRRVMEFAEDLGPTHETEQRRVRLEQSAKTRARFATFGDELWDLRLEMEDLSQRLVSAITLGHNDREERTRQKLRRVESRDPELCYLMELMEKDSALREGRDEDVEKHHKRAMEARSVCPCYNLDGLWLGKYGDHGYEMINVTYAGDILVASKVTGDENVPKGEITFQVDLSPLRYVSFSKSDDDDDDDDDNDNVIRKEKALEPIMLTDEAASKWGTRQLPRYRGLGQVAEEGFNNHQWLDGQLILIGEKYFSFAWLPIEQQIFFGRPSPELVLTMLRENGASSIRGTGKKLDAPPALDADVKLQKDFALQCLEKTDEVHDELFLDEDAELGCIWDGAHTEECYFQ